MIFSFLDKLVSYSVIGVVVTIACIFFYFTSSSIVPWIINKLLSTFNGGTRGVPIKGPKWKWPNGQFAEKFLDGRRKSEEWQRYGPVYRIWAGMTPEIVLTTPEDIRNFHTDSANHGKPLDGNFGWFFGQVLGRCVGLLEFDEWKNMRRVVDPVFRHGSVVSRASNTIAESKLFVDNLRRYAVASEKEKSDDTKISVHAASAFMKFPFYFTAEAVYGRMSDDEKDQLWFLAEKRLALLPYFFLGSFYRTSWLKWFDHAAYSQLRDFTDNWAAFNKQMADSRRQQGVSTPIVSYIDEANLGNITMDEVTHTLDEMLFANLDVTTHVLTWAITLVADHAQVKQALQEEILANENNLEEYIAKSNTHLHRCYQESLRVRPLALFSIGESAETEKNFRGIRVKPKTMVLIDTLAINVRNPFWGEDSETYNPDRFKTVKQTDLRYNLYAFGFGHRKCLGQHLAGQMVKAIMVHLFSQHEVRIKEGHGGDGGDQYRIDKSTWVPVADVIIELSKLEAPAV